MPNPTSTPHDKPLSDEDMKKVSEEILREWDTSVWHKNEHGYPEMQWVKMREFLEKSLTSTYRQAYDAGYKAGHHEGWEEGREGNISK